VARPRAGSGRADKGSVWAPSRFSEPTSVNADLAVW
jgi:hypothetical protein